MFSASFPLILFHNSYVYKDWFIAMRLIMLEGYSWICRLITTYSKHLSTIILHINYVLHMPLFLIPTEVLSWWLWTYFYSFSYVTNIIIEYNSPFQTDEGPDMRIFPHGSSGSITVMQRGFRLSMYFLRWFLTQRLGYLDINIALTSD